MKKQKRKFYVPELGEYVKVIDNSLIRRLSDGKPVRLVQDSDAPSEDYQGPSPSEDGAEFYTVQQASPGYWIIDGKSKLVPTVILESTKTYVRYEVAVNCIKLIHHAKSNKCS